MKPAEPTPTQPNTSAEPAGTQATSTEPTSNLPELVVDGQDKKKKKAAKSNEKAYVAPTTGEATTAAPPPPGVTLGTAAKSDTGTTTFDASNVKMRTDGGGDANTFMRNLPNVQYQQTNSNNPGASADKTVDTKPALMAISGGRVYENNFIVNGVSVSNISGPIDPALPVNGGVAGTKNTYGQSPQSIYVPAEFIGQATVIDSNASAEYGQFMGGVVSYDLTAPPTDRYHASVSASRDTSDFAHYVLATPNGTNPQGLRPPDYVKNTLAVSIGAPITSDFAFIAQASRKEAESGKPKVVEVGGGYAEEKSDNIFYRFAATARTDIGKFTFDTSRTDYSQHWEHDRALDSSLDMAKEATSTQLKYETDLAGVRVDGIGLGRVKLKSTAYYNSDELQNKSPGNRFITRAGQQADYDPVAGEWQETWTSSQWGACRFGPLELYPPEEYGYTLRTECGVGGSGDRLQSNSNFGVETKVSGNVLLGTFLVGMEVKKYNARETQLEDEETTFDSPVTAFASGVDSFDCAPGDDTYCNSEQYSPSYSFTGKRDVSVALNAVHTYAQIDQTWEWFNLRAGVRYDYDDYQKNHNIAPRLAGTIAPFDGVSITAGYNRYYIGETIYYAVRDKDQPIQLFTREDCGTPPCPFGDPTTEGFATRYTTDGLSTPYSDEYTAALGIRDPLLNGQWRFRYLERFGKDQFATVACGTGCVDATNDGSRFYRSASAEYTKEWHGLQNVVNLNAAAITGDVTWSMQRSHGTYLVNSDTNGDGNADWDYIAYKGNRYRSEEFVAVTGNLDIPVRFGATLATVWFDDLLELNFSAGVNLGFEGVYQNGITYDGSVPGCSFSLGDSICAKYEDRKYGASLKLDISGQVNVTEQAAIQFQVNNITNSTQQVITDPLLSTSPWVLGRSYWLGSSLRF